MESNPASSSNHIDPISSETASSASEDAGSDLDPQALKIAALESQLKEKESKYVYLYADFENFKKRALKERQDFLKFGWESTAIELLQIVDNLDRAVAHTSPGTDKVLVEGIRMVLNQIQSLLEKQNILPIKTERQVFDPNLHEAVGQEASSEAEGIIIKEHTRGYTIHGRLLRPARVIVSSGGKSV